MTIKFNNVYVENVSTVAGPFVIEGPLKDNFDKKFTDFYDGEKTFEKCEMKELKESIKILLDKTKYNEEDISFGISADLMNQLTISNFVYSKLNIPFLGVYNACASVCEEILIAASILENKKNKKAICTTSSHNMTSERQFRNPVEYGAPKPKTTTFTVTGAASETSSNGGNGTTSRNAVSTADNSPIGTMSALAVASILAGGYVIVRRRKKDI